MDGLQRCQRCQRVSCGFYILVGELEADPQDGVGHRVLPLPDVKQGLAEVPTKVEVGPNAEAFGSLIPTVVEPLAQFPAALPCFLMCIWRAGAVKDPLPVDGTEVGERIAQCPAFLKSCLQRTDLPPAVHMRACDIVIVTMSVVDFGLVTLRYVCVVCSAQVPETRLRLFGSTHSPVHQRSTSEALTDR